MIAAKNQDIQCKLADTIGEKFEPSCQTHIQYNQLDMGILKTPL